MLGMVPVTLKKYCRVCPTVSLVYVLQSFKSVRWGTLAEKLCLFDMPDRPTQ